VTLASKACRRAFLIVNFLCCLRRIILNCHRLDLGEVFGTAGGRAAYKRRLVKLIALVLYQLHELVLVESIVDLATASQLLRRVKNLCLLG